MRRFSVLLFLLHAVFLLGKTPVKSELLSVNEGLSQGMVFDIRQSRDGFLWIATKDGLNRYDGYHFKVFTHDPFDPFSIVANEVWKIFEDSRGWLWVVCPGGLDVFLPQSERFFHLLPGLQGFNGDSVSFTETSDGTIWITVAGKFWKIEVPRGAIEKAESSGNAFPGLPVKQVELPGTMFSTVFLTGDETLLVGSTKGVFGVDPADASLQMQALAGTSVDILGEDPQGQLWLVALSPQLEGLFRQAEYGMWRWKVNSESPRRVPCLPYGKYRFDNKGYLWAWKFNDNIYRKWDPEKFAKGEAAELEWLNDHDFTQNPYYFPTTLAFDESGNAWVGTNGFGVLRITFHSPGFRSHLPFTSQRMITESPDGHLFLQTDLLHRYPSFHFQGAIPVPWKIPSASNERITVITFDRQETCWANKGADSLFRLVPPPAQPRGYSWKALGLITCRNGKLLGVREEGLMQFDPATGQSRLIAFDQPQQAPPAFSYLQFLYEAPTGMVWIFAFEGLIQAIPEGDGYRFRYYKNNQEDRNSLSGNTVLSVAADPLEPARYLWVGTKGAGLNRLDLQTGVFKHYKKEQGLPDNVIYGILPDEHGHIWMSTNRGICRFHVREEHTRNFTVADGLQNNEFNQSSYLKTRDGHLIFGGVNGLTVFHPDSLRFNERKPNTAITRIWVNNQLAGFRILEGNQDQPPILEQIDSQNTRLELNHKQNLVSLEFAALEFSNPTQNQYRYQLLRKGAWGELEQADWVELGYKNNVQFANLRPGSYIFKVLGSNHDGTWSGQPAVLTFTIHPPWWAAWWAYLLYAMALGAVLGYVYRYQLRQRLQRQETLRLRELDEFKNRFFTHITHEFRTPLTVILGISDKLQREKRAPEKSILLIRRSGENLLRLINQLLDLAKLESNTLKIHYVQGDVLPYLHYITESLHSLANAQNVMLRVESHAAEIVMDYDPERMLQIVYNLLSNAIKFTPSGGRVLLRADPQIVEGQKHLMLTVTDTGVGIPPEDLPRIFDRFFQANNPEKVRAGGTGIGLALTRELVKAMGGDIQVESQVGRGTAFTISLPISNRAEMGKEVVPAFPMSPQRLPGDPEGLPSPSGNRPSVLIIEDNPDVVAYLASCLQDQYALDFAYNGRAGIEMALEKVPDLIISDVMMPEKDGFEVCETLKHDKRSSHIPIVLLTAKAGVENRIAGLRRGADAYLSKPFHEEELQATLQNLLELRKKLQARYGNLEVASGKEPVSEPASFARDPEQEFLDKVKTVILDHLSDGRFSVEDLCRELALSQPQLHRKLTALTGKNATRYIRSVRLAKARELLLSREKNVSEVAYEVGFDDPKYFSRVFSEEYGLPPSKV